MKKYQLLNSIFIVILSLMGSTAQGQNTTLSGHLEGLKNGTVKIFYIKEGRSITDTVSASENEFVWKVDLNVPVRVALTVDSGNYYFFAAPGHMHLTGMKDSLQSYELSGAPMQQDANTYKVLTKSISQQWDSLFQAYKTASAAEKASIEKQRNDLRIKGKKLVQQFVLDHPGSLFSMYLIGLENSYTDIKNLYHLLDETARQTEMGKRIAKRLKHLATREIGATMPDFTQPDTSGHLVHFHEFKKPYKYILIDFWASWCAPCRAENPNVLKAYKAYQSKGFTVIGISLDKDQDRWKKAIRQDKMPWTQLSDLKGWKNELASKMGIEFIPSNLLIDASGKIIAKDLRGVDLENKLSELMH